MDQQRLKIAVVVKDKNINNKHINIWLDEIIINNTQLGNLHFFITINFEENIKNIEKLLTKINKLKNLINENIQLVSWYHICWEFNKNENYHLHLILSVRSLIGYNNVVCNNIQFFLRNNFELDTQVNLLTKFIDIKRSWRYVFKEFLTNKNSEIYSINSYVNLFDNLKNIIKIKKIKTDSEFILGKINDNNKHDSKTIIILIDYYLNLNEIFIYKNNLYQKTEKSMISFKKIGEISDLYDNFKNILMYFKTYFPIHFNNFDVINFIGSNLTNKEDKLKRLVDFTTQKIIPDFNIMEFTDGVYFILNNKFLRKDKFYKKNGITLEDFLNNKKIYTIKYYNCSFSNLKNPNLWLESIEKVLGLKESKNTKDKIMNFFNLNEDAKWLLIYIAYIFHYGSNELNKQGTLYIWGNSNTGKTTLVINILINYFGKENIGLLSNNKNFEYQHIMDKKLLILDEFDISKVNFENFKKLLSKELLLGEKKNKDPEIIPNIPLLISSNQKLDINGNMKDLQPIHNRIKSIHFKNIIENREQNSNINEELNKEEAKIIIYCNRTYFNWIKKNKINWKQKLLK